MYDARLCIYLSHIFITYLHCLMIWQQPNWNPRVGIWIIGRLCPENCALKFRQILVTGTSQWSPEQAEMFFFIRQKRWVGWGAEKGKRGGGSIHEEYIAYQFSSVQLLIVSNSLRPHRLQHARPLCPSPSPGVYSNSCPLSWWCHPRISSPLSSPSPPTFNLSQHQGLFKWVSSLHQVAKVLEFQLQHQSFQWFRTDFV